jgi:hypothetical protein
MVEKPKLLLFSSAAAGILRTVLQLKFDAAAVRHSGLTSATMSVTCASTFHYMLRIFLLNPTYTYGDLWHSKTEDAGRTQKSH